jgi:hypothetical protein
VQLLLIKKTALLESNNIMDKLKGKSLFSCDHTIAHNKQGKANISG